jgi:hypothetical protein
VASRILSVEPYYSKFEDILPEELIHADIPEELRKAKNAIDNIIGEDQQNIQNLAARVTKQSALNSSTVAITIKMGFALKKDKSQDKILLFQYAHWIMSLTSLQYLALSVINLSVDLKTYCNNYMNGTGQDKKKAFAEFIVAYSDFKGYLINLRMIFTQYYDNFVLACNEVDPNQKEQRIGGIKSDTGYDQLIAATKELLLRGGMGRLTGFSSLRSAIEVYVTRNLFSLKNSQKYSANQIDFPKEIPSLKSICTTIENNPNLAQYFDTDSLRRLYDWQSIVAHRGLLTEEYLIWFVYYHTEDLLAAFMTNFKQHGDEILDELQKLGLIKII